MDDHRATGGAEVAAREQLLLLIDSVVDYAIFMLDPTGHIATWNRGAERLKGWRAEEVIGQHFSRFYPEEDVLAGKPDRELVVAIRDGRIEDEGWRVRKDGSRFWANVVITAVHGPDGTLQGFGKVTRDLSQRKRTEDALRDVLGRERETAARLRELDRLKSDFVAIVAHDIRAPLSVISGFGDLLLNNWDAMPPSRRQESLERIVAGTSSLSQLVDDVLEVARIEAGQLHVVRTRVDLREVANRAAMHVTPSDGLDRVHLDIAHNVPPVLADEQRLWQVLTNLLSNALKFSPVDSTVEVRVRRTNGEVRVDIRDSGPGIPADQQLKVFDRFTRLARPGAQHTRGTGLGLYISKSFVEALGGRIWVESEPGAGATFSIVLPVAAQDAA